jgi:hypothetical protein
MADLTFAKLNAVLGASAPFRLITFADSRQNELAINFHYLTNGQVLDSLNQEKVALFFNHLLKTASRAQVIHNREENTADGNFLTSYPRANTSIAVLENETEYYVTNLYQFTCKALLDESQIIATTI